VPALAAYTYLAFYGLLLAVIVDAVLVSVRIRKQVKVRFPDESSKGIGFYAVMRSLQIRRMRVPKPRVKIGQPI
jgi:Protein of unknown function (DUF3043)